jgi:hypothetical protein
MEALTIHQRIALQIGELIMEVRRLEILNEQSVKQIYQMEKDASKQPICEAHSLSDALSE